MTLKLGEYTALLDALEWTPDEFREATGVDVGFDSSEPGPQTVNVARTDNRVRFAGVVSAGAFGASLIDEERSLVGAPDWIADRYDLSKVFAVEVSGDSMLADDARRAIPEGSLVFFHSALQPEYGEIVCVRLLESDISIIKKYIPGDQYTTLESFNREHEPIILNSSKPAQVEGVYLTHIPRPPRLR